MSTKECLTVVFMAITLFWCGPGNWCVKAASQPNESKELRANKNKPKSKTQSPKKSNGRKTSPSSSESNISSEIDNTSRSSHEQNNQSGGLEGYMYSDIPNFSRARYTVIGSKAADSNAVIGVLYYSSSSKTESELSQQVSSISGPGISPIAYGVLNSAISIYGGLTYLNAAVKSTTTSENSDSSTITGSITDTSIPFGASFHASKTVDVGLNIAHESLSTKTTATSIKYSYMTFKGSVGTHAPSFEASLSYQPGTKTKRSVTFEDEESGQSTTSSTDLDIASELNIHGRFAFTKKLFAGGSFDTTSEKNEKSTKLGLEIGVTSATFEGTIGIVNEKTTATETEESSAYTSSGTGIVMEGATRGVKKRSRYGASFLYIPTKEQDDSSRSTTSLLQLSALMSIYF